MKQSVNLEDYKGTEISKGFESNSIHQMEETVKSNLEKGLIDQDTFDKAMFELDLVKGKPNEKVDKVMGEFKAGTLKTSAGDVVTDRKQAIAIAMSEAGIGKQE